jgi:hypothetical protein
MMYATIVHWLLLHFFSSLAARMIHICNQLFSVLVSSFLLLFQLTIQNQISEIVRCID